MPSTRNSKIQFVFIAKRRLVRGVADQRWEVLLSFSAAVGNLLYVRLVPRGSHQAAKKLPKGCSSYPRKDNRYEPGRSSKMGEGGHGSTRTSNFLIASGRIYRRSAGNVRTLKCHESVSGSCELFVFSRSDWKCSLPSNVICLVPGRNVSELLLRLIPVV